MSDNERKEDKIFNNKYKSGEGLIDPNDYEFNSSISVESSYSSKYLRELYDYENSVEYKVLLESILDIMNEDEVMSELIKNKKGSRNIFNKEEVNIFFKRTIDALKEKTDRDKFYNPIYVLEAISNVTSMKYKKIFDYLDYEYKEILLVELDKKYKFLSGKMNTNKKMF